MPVFILSREPTTVSLKLISALINMLMAPIGKPNSTSAAGIKNNAGSADSVPIVSLRAKLTEVRDSVALIVMIYVVNQVRRLLSVMQKPDNSVQKIPLSLKVDAKVAFGVGVTAQRSSFAAGVVNFPPNITSVGVVVQQFFKLIWDNLAIHSVTPHVVVRGRSALTGRYPALYPSLGIYC
jgi:hypothetical protein